MRMSPCGMRNAPSRGEELWVSEMQTMRILQPGGAVVVFGGGETGVEVPSSAAGMELGGGEGSGSGFNAGRSSSVSCETASSEQVAL